MFLSQQLLSGTDLPGSYATMPSSELSHPDPPLELAIVIPTYNEQENIDTLLAALTSTLSGIEWEAIIVDDNSPDGTAEYSRGIAATNRRVRVLERIGRRGLSSACIEGMLATSSPYIAVMDGDLQHDESILPKMLNCMKSEGLDVVIASRHMGGASMGELAPERVRLSKLGTRLSRLVCRVYTSDPMSGFFLVHRVFLQQVVHRLTGTGFKILVDLLASSAGPVSIGEVPYHFRDRRRGESKLDVNAEFEFLYLLLDKAIGGVIPARFVLFALVGALGVVVHLTALTVLYYLGNASFLISQAMATFVAMTFNFLLNNVITFRDQRLRGPRLLTGLMTFYLACSLGALMNVSFGQFLMRSGIPWYLAGLCGMMVSSVWNYGVNSMLTWRHHREIIFP